MCNTLSEIPPGEPASVGDERACACVPRTERQEESPRNAAAPSRARGSPLGLFVWAASITEQHGPRYTVLTAPLSRCCHKDCSQTAGWGCLALRRPLAPYHGSPLQTCRSSCSCPAGGADATAGLRARGHPHRELHVASTCSRREDLYHALLLSQGLEPN